MEESLWPLRGVLLFLRSPRWWLRPMLGMMLALFAFIGIGLGVAWGLWPSVTTTGWSWWLYALMAVGLAVASVVVAWVLLLPLLMSFLLEDLARKAVAYAKAEAAKSPGADLFTTVNRVVSQELSIMPSILASLKVLGGTLPIRLGWISASFICGLIIAPLGVVVSALGMGHIACIDAIDISLGLRGFTGASRLAALKVHRNDVRQAALTAGLLHLGLAVTVIGWLLWLPGIVVGAALRTRTWPDQRSELKTSSALGEPGV